MNGATAEENCVRDALELVIGLQPPLLPNVPPRRANAAGANGGD